MKILITSLLFVFLFSSCNKATKPEWMVYYETSCVPEWVNFKSDRKTKKRLTNFLKDNGIIPLKIKIEGKRTQTCGYCDCSTGKIYYVQIDRTQGEYIEWFGFVKK